MILILQTSKEACRDAAMAVVGGWCRGRDCGQQWRQSAPGGAEQRPCARRGVTDTAADSAAVAAITSWQCRAGGRVRQAACRVKLGGDRKVATEVSPAGARLRLRMHGHGYARSEGGKVTGAGAAVMDASDLKK